MAGSPACAVFDVQSLDFPGVQKKFSLIEFDVCLLQSHTLRLLEGRVDRLDQTGLGHLSVAVGGSSTFG